MRVPTRLYFALCLLLLAPASRASAQTAGPEKAESVRTSPAGPTYQYVTIRLDNTGVASWKYRNARNPPKVWDRKNPVADWYRLRFSNETSGVTVKVILPAVKVPFVASTSPDVAAFIPATLLGLDVAAARAEAQRLVNLSLEFADLAVARARDEVADVAEMRCLTQYVLDDATTNEAKLSELILSASKVGDQAASSDKTALLESKEMRSAKAVASRILSQPLDPKFRDFAFEPKESCKDLGKQVPTSASDARARLEKFRADHSNRAGSRPAVAIASAIDALEQATAAVLMYAEQLKLANAPPTTATPANPPATAKELARGIFGVSLDTCDAKDGDVTCVPSLTIAPNGEAWIDELLLNGYPARAVIKFRVAFPFALESEQPSDQFGFFRLDDTLLPSPTTATLSAAGAMSFARDPYFGAAGATIDDSYRYEGAHTWQLKGSARTSVAYAMADRATATVEVQFKNGIVGRKDEDLAVKVNQYNFQIFGLTGGTLKFGKYLFAAPTDGLAISETGEGITARYKWAALSHIVKREGAGGAPDPDDRDHRVWLGEITNIALSNETPIRSLSFYGLRGTDKALGRERSYQTIGGEAGILFPRLFVTGTLAYYDSRSNPKDDSESTARSAKGKVWLARISKSWFDGTKPLRTASLTLAGGSGDNRQTVDRYEGYLGENAAYAPDASLFVTGLVPRLRLEPWPFFIVDASGNPVLDKDGNSTQEFTEKGLSNRSFLGLTLTDQTLSPLEWLSVLRIIPLKDVESRQTTFRLHQYRSNQLVAGSRVTMWEAQLEFLLESPKGVKTIVKVSRLLATGSLGPLFPSEPYSLVAQINVSLK